MQSGMLWLSVLESAKLNEKKYIYILWKTSNFEVVGWKILELRKAISKYLHKCRPKEFGDEGEREGKERGKNSYFLLFCFFFFFGSSTRWKKFPFRFYTEIILEVLYRFRKTMGRVVGGNWEKKLTAAVSWLKMQNLSKSIMRK